MLFVRLFDLCCLVLSVSSSSWCLGRAAVCDCGTPWTFFLPFLFHTDVIFFYQGTVSAIKFRKRLVKFKITIGLPKKFDSKGVITAVKVTKI